MNSTQHMQFHDVANIFPMMGDEEYRALVADIKANGLHQPIWTYQGKIIDGRNRYKACLEAGIEPQFREWNGEGSLIVFVVSLNLNRRHLTSSQKAMVAIEVEKRLAEENKVGRPAKDTEKGGNISTISGKSRDHAAAIVGTNGRYVTDAKKIVEKAPELEEVVRCGKLTIPDAKKVANLPEDLRQSVLAKVEEIHKDGPPRRDHKTWDLISEAKREERRSLLTELARRKASSKSEVHVYRSHRIYERIYCTLHKGGIEALQDNIEPASVDAIITQPPDPGNIDYDELGEFAAYALEDGGSLVIVTSSDAVRQTYIGLDKHLTYRQTLSYLLSVAKDKKDRYFTGHFGKTHKRLHSPIVWYIKGQTASPSVDDQLITEDEYSRSLRVDNNAVFQLVGLFSQEYQLICDPFDANGLTFCASAMRDRDYIGAAPDLRKGWETIMKEHSSLAYLDGDETHNAYCDFCEMCHPPYRDREQSERFAKTVDYSSLPDDEISGIGKYSRHKYEEVDLTCEDNWGGCVTFGFLESEVAV